MDLIARWIRPISLTSILLLFAFAMVGCENPQPASAPRRMSAVATTRPTPFRFAPIFCSRMVLQRDMPLPVFGTSEPGDRVTVRVGDETRQAVTDLKGHWQATFSPLRIGEPFEVNGVGHEGGIEKKLTFTDVLAGEVWVCSGQSNMELLVSSCTNAKQEIAASACPLIRVNSGSPSFVKASGREWVESSPGCIGNCSAVGYFFGRELYKDLNVPIGLVVRAVGGTVIKQWAPKDGPVIEAHPDLEPLRDDWRRASATYDESKRTYSAWQATARQIKAIASAEFGPPVPLDPKKYGGMYAAQIEPLMPFAIRGVIWYQGETDARNGRSDDQRGTLPLMIAAWRDAWGQGDFPFLLVQLANDWGGNGVTKAPELPTIPPENHQWPWVREAQAAACKLLPNTAMACVIDLGGKIHYPGKQDVARRLARLAEAQVYHLPVMAAGPSYRSMEVEGNRVRLHFGEIGEGLVTRDKASLQGFAIAGEDRHFIWAEAKIEGDTVVVSSPRVGTPRAVRYDWLNDPHGNLYNAEGLPTAPFRTDDWPRVSTSASATVTRPEPKQ